MALPWIHRIWPWSFDRLSNQIVQVDLVLNWAEVKEDFVCRHLRLTNRLGQQEYVAISSIRPTMQSLAPRKYPLVSNLKETIYKTAAKANATSICSLMKSRAMKLDFKCEGLKLSLNYSKVDYTMNRGMLRAVLNGYGIDMN